METFRNLSQMTSVHARRASVTQLPAKAEVRGSESSRLNVCRSVTTPTGTCDARQKKDG